MKTYTFSDVLRLTPATRSQVIHLTAKRVIVPDLSDATGTGNRRAFGLLNLVECTVAHEMVEFGIEHYAIAQILRRVRWVAGDPKGLESWRETFMKASRGNSRRRVDLRLMSTEDRFWRQFYNDWINDPPPSDLLDDEARAFRERIRSRHGEIAERYLVKRADGFVDNASDWNGYDRAVAAMVAEEVPGIRQLRDDWRRFLDPNTRPAFTCLATWPTYTRDYQQITPAGVDTVKEARWVFDLVSSPDALLEALATPFGRFVLNLRAIVTDLEAATGEALHDAERERLSLRAPAVVTASVRKAR